MKPEPSLEKTPSNKDRKEIDWRRHRFLMEFAILGAIVFVALGGLVVLAVADAESKKLVNQIVVPVVTGLVGLFSGYQVTPRPRKPQDRPSS